MTSWTNEGEKEKKIGESKNIVLKVGLLFGYNKASFWWLPHFPQCIIVSMALFSSLLFESKREREKPLIFAILHVLNRLPCSLKCHITNNFCVLFLPGFYMWEAHKIFISGTLPWPTSTKEVKFVCESPKQPKKKMMSITDPPQREFHFRLSFSLCLNFSSSSPKSLNDHERACLMWIFFSFINCWLQVKFHHILFFLSIDLRMIYLFYMEREQERENNWHTCNVFVNLFFLFFLLVPKFIRSFFLFHFLFRVYVNCMVCSAKQRW